MAIKVLNTRYEYYDGSAVNFLLANVGEPIRVIHDILIETYAINSTNNPMIVNNKDGYYTTGSDIWITGGDFTDFEVGDTVQIANYLTNTVVVGNPIVVEKLSNTEIKLSSNPVGWGANTVATQDVFSVVKKPTAVFYRWNFVENSEQSTFLSLVDNSEQVASVTGLDPALSNTYPMQMLGSKCYQLGTITITEAGVNTNPIYGSKFTITHDAKLTPIILANQWNDLLNSISPYYFNNTNCLKGIFDFESRYTLTNPNDTQSIRVENILGNSGWYNENFNTGITNYSISNLAWQQSTPLVTIPKCQLKVGNASKFSFDIVNTTSSPFSNNNTELILNFAKAPNFETEYQNNNRDLLHNFVWESKTIKASTTPTPVNGDNYADSGLRSLKGLTATYISATTIRIAGEIDMLTDAVNVFNESDEPRYIFFITVQNHTLTNADADRVTLLVDASPFYFKVDYPDLVEFNTFKIIPHDIEDFTTTFDLRDVFEEDELVGYCAFDFKNYDFGLGPQTKEIIRATGRIIAYNTSTFERFTLETNTINVANTPIVNGLQYFNITQPRAHHVPVNEIRKPIRFYFDTVSGNYVFAYPYLNDWSYWEALQGVNNDFFDVNEPNNGENKSWINYSDGTWKVGFEFEIAIKVNGVPALYSNKQLYDIYPRNYDGGTIEQTFCEINTYDPDTNSLLSAGGNKYILGYKPTLVKATFENNNVVFGDPFTDLTDLTVVIGLEVFEEGGVNGKRRMSSKYVSDNDTWFIPLSGETKVKLINSTNTLEASVLIDNTLININKPKYKLTARVYNIEDAINYQTGLNFPDITAVTNYLGSQDLLMIKENPVDTITTTIPSTEIGCSSDFVWRVLADSVANSELKNDTNTFIWWFNKDAITSANLFLVKNDGTEYALTSVSTYGTPYNYGFFTNGNNDKHVAYNIEWRKVLLTLGECVYTVKCVITNIFGGTQTLISVPYCLKQYTDARANGTVRVEYYLNGVLGRNDIDTKFRDFGTLNWYNQHRFDGVFYYETSKYKEEEIQYTNGQVIDVENEQTVEFALDLKAIPFFKHEILRTDILQADRVLITDYNSKNLNNFYKKEVKRISEYTPKFNILQNKVASIQIKFKQSYNNLRKFISG